MSDTNVERIQELEEEVRRLKSVIAKQNETHRQILRQYVSDEVMQALISSDEDATLASERREVTMVFTDIRRSTELSESLDPESYIRLLNHYLESMIMVVDSWGGNILGFAGDALIVVFGAPIAYPKAARYAVRCAVSMQRNMGRVNKWNLEQGYPEIEMGIGIHTGEVIMGCIGSTTRMKYDAIGRNVNLAARLVSYAQGGQVYVSDSTMAEAGDDIVERPEGKQFVTPKGIQGTICIHDIVGIGTLRLPSFEDA